MNRRIIRISAGALFFTAVVLFAGNVRAGDSLVIADFEDSKRPVITYAGPGSTMTAEYQTAIVHGGKQALKTKMDTSNWAGTLIELSGATADWTGYSKLKLWVYGSKSGRRFNIDLEEKGKEQCRYTITDDFEGWKEFVIKLSEFLPRTDWQPNDADKNGKLDFPLKTIQFFTSASFGSTLYFDDISIEK